MPQEDDLDTTLGVLVVLFEGGIAARSEVVQCTLFNVTSSCKPCILCLRHLIGIILYTSSSLSEVLLFL